MNTPDAQPAVRRPPPILIGVGLLVVALGFGLPRLLTDPTPTPSPPAPATAAPAPADGSGFGRALARMVGGLVAVGGLCAVVVRLVARRTPAQPVGMEVVASLPIDARCSVHLVKAGERRLLIGTDFSGVKALVELPGLPTEEPAAVPQPEAAEPVVVGPVPVAVTAPVDRISREAIEALIARLRQAA